MIFGVAALLVMLVVGLYLEELTWSSAAGWLFFAAIACGAAYRFHWPDWLAPAILVYMACILILVVFKETVYAYFSWRR